MDNLRVGERVVGRRAVALNGAELVVAIGAGLEEVRQEAGLTEDEGDWLRRAVGQEMQKCALLGKGHLSFPKISWAVGVGRRVDGKVWVEVSVRFSGSNEWIGRIVERPEDGSGSWRVQAEDDVPDRIRQRWGLGTSVEIRGVDGKLRTREIQFGGPRQGQTGSPESVSERAPVEAEAVQVELLDGRASLPAREPARLDKADLLAEPVEMEVGLVSEGARPAGSTAPTGVKLKGKGGKG